MNAHTAGQSRLGQHHARSPPPIAAAPSRLRDTFKHAWPLLAPWARRARDPQLRLHSYADAMRGVVQWNERAEAAFEDAHPDAPSRLALEARYDTRAQGFGESV